MIRTASILGLLALSACVMSREDRAVRDELDRYYMVQTRGDVSFLPGGLSQEDLAGDLPEQYARLQKESVTCRADFVIGPTGGVTHICTTCTQIGSEQAQYAFRISDSYVRRLRFDPGEAGRKGALTISYAPMRPDASLILPRVSAPETGCAPQPVNA